MGGKGQQQSYGAPNSFADKWAARVQEGGGYGGKSEGGSSGGSSGPSSGGSSGSGMFDVGDYSYNAKAIGKEAVKGALLGALAGPTASLATSAGMAGYEAYQERENQTPGPAGTPTISRDKEKTHRSLATEDDDDDNEGLGGFDAGYDFY